MDIALCDERHICCENHRTIGDGEKAFRATRSSSEAPPRSVEIEILRIDW